MLVDCTDNWIIRHMVASTEFQTSKACLGALSQQSHSYTKVNTEKAEMSKYF